MPALTVEQEHLLKRELMRLCIARESAGLDNCINIDQLGSPFVEKDGTASDGSKFPVIRYVFVNFIVPFPLLRHATKNFWSGVAQPFIQDLASKDISSSADRDEATKRRRAGRVFKRMLLILMVAGVSSNRKPEASDAYKSKPRYSAIDTHGAELDPRFAPTQDSAETANAAGADPAAQPATGPAESNGIQGPPGSMPAGPAPVLPPLAPGEVPGPIASAIGVRMIPSSSFFRSKEYEFIVEAQHWGGPPVWTAHTYHDFVAFNKRLIKMFPGKPLASLPAKNSTDVTLKLDDKDVVLVRERQRTTLRAYLHRLCSIPKVAHSQVFQEFLFKDKIPALSQPEIDDILARQKLDRQRWADSDKFYELAQERAAKLETYFAEIKSSILLEDALPKLFLEMKRHDKVEDMSPLLQKFVEWCLIEVAAALYNLLIARDNSPEVFSQVKRIHHLLPYKLMQGILKLSNPAVIMKRLTDLFMATPFGGTSLLQSMFMRVLADDMRSYDALIDELEAHINNKTLIKPLRDYAWTTYQERQEVYAVVDKTHKDIALVVLQQANLPPALLSDVESWHDQWQKAVSASEPEKQQQADVDRYSQLKDLLKLTVRKRDKDILRDFWADPMTIKFIRQIVNLLYDLFIEIFRTARVSESVGDLERFINDVIAFVQYADGGVALNANQMVDELVAVCRKHQNSLFRFVHRVYSKDDGVFVDFVSWLTLFVNFVRDGKQGKHTVDLLGLVDKAVAANAIDLEVLTSDLDTLNTWLLNRAATADPLYKGGPDSDFAPKQFDLEDVGLTWQDVDFGLAEVEVDEQEEFVPELTPDLGQDAVTQERVRRQKKEQMESRWAELTPRPNSREISKLAPLFHKLVGEVLAKARVEPTSIADMMALEAAEARDAKPVSAGSAAGGSQASSL